MSQDKERILVVDDSADTLEILERKLASRGFQVVTARQVESAIQMLENQASDLVITDYKMPRLTGMDLIKFIVKHDRSIRIIMITGYPSVENAVDAVKSGAAEYLPKPFTDEELFSCLTRVLSHIRKDEGVVGVKPNVMEQVGLVGRSDAMKEVIRSIEKAADNLVPVLITGEYGTSREQAAWAVHCLSESTTRPFITVNWGAVPETVRGEDLLGINQEPVDGDRKSLAASIDVGTLFLDHLGEMDETVQKKLLRFLENRQAVTTDPQNPVLQDIRLVTAADRQLPLQVERGTFDKDLYRRLNIIGIHLPSLWERKEDIPLVADSFLRKWSRLQACAPPVLSEDALQVLRAYPWPANDRELESLIRWLVFTYPEKTITPSDLPAHMKAGLSIYKGCERTLAQAEQAYIREVVAYTGGIKSKAASILGIDRKTLRRKLADGDASSEKQ